ncbi:YopX family protein, partial [Streptococcus pneumoniae]
MTPRYRAWIKTEKRMFFSDDILAIDYENKEIVTQQVYFENGLPDDRDIYCYDFDEIELMQSTGLKDKNGKEIFEGDIVRTTRFLGRADEIGGFYEYDKEFIGIVKQLEGSWVIDTGSD